MEKYSQFRDKGTAIAPFLPVPSPPASVVWTPLHIALFCLRVPFLLAISAAYFCFLEVFPVGSTIKYIALWIMLGIPGVWWVDLQIDGVKRGQLASAKDHLPKAGTIVASSFTSPLDPLYLAGIFQPIFTRSYASTRKVERISLWSAIRLAFSQPLVNPPANAKLVTLQRLSAVYPSKIICVFPETTTTNGRGILPLSPSLLSAGGDTKIYPVNLRYTPQDVTTPVPGGVISWFWNLLSKPSHQMRVRIAHRIYNSRAIDKPLSSISKTPASAKAAGTGYDTNIFDTPDFRKGWDATDDAGMDVDVGGDGDSDGDVEDDVSLDEQKVLDRVAEDLARLGRVKRVGLGVEEKIEFVGVWGKRRR